MKGSKIKTITIILAIILVALVGFFGVYTHVQNRMENQVKEYSYATDINGARKLKLKVSDETNDSGEAKNSEEVKTTENYKLSKEIIENRLKESDVQDYKIRVNESTGDIWIELPENKDTDQIISNLTVVSKFEITDSDTQEVLMNNDDIKSVQVLYGSESQTSTGTSVYLSIQFNKEGTKKFEEITNKYTPNATTDSTTDENNSQEETNTTEETTNSTEEGTDNSTESEEKKEKQVSMKIDDTEIIKTSFEQPIANGLLQLSYGQSSTDNATIEENANKANEVAVLLRNKKLPITYEVEENQYVLSDISRK